MSTALQAYAGAKKDEIPIGGYAALVGAFAAIFGGALALGAKKLPRKIRVGDLLLLGVATHKLTRILTRDWVTTPLRFPFTRYEGNDGAGEVNEKSRGRGLQRAIGDLVTCPFCSGPWVAGALVAGLVARPRETRVVAGALGVVTLSDFLHQAYSKVRK